MEVYDSSFEHTARLVIKKKSGLAFHRFNTGTVLEQFGDTQQIVVYRIGDITKIAYNVYVGDPLKRVHRTHGIRTITSSYNILEATFDEDIPELKS